MPERFLCRHLRVEGDVDQWPLSTQVLGSCLCPAFLCQVLPCLCREMLSIQITMWHEGWGIIISLSPPPPCSAPEHTHTHTHSHAVQQLYDGLRWRMDHWLNVQIHNPGPDTMHNYFKLMSGKKKVDLLWWMKSHASSRLMSAVSHWSW